MFIISKAKKYYSGFISVLVLLNQIPSPPFFVPFYILLQFQVSSLFSGWPVFSEVEIPGIFQVFGKILVIFQGFPKIFPRLFSYSLDNNTHGLHQSLSKIFRKNRQFSICVYFSHFRQLLLKIITKLETILKTTYLN